VAAGLSDKHRIGLTIQCPFPRLVGDFDDISTRKSSGVEDLDWKLQRGMLIRYLML
jgi:hypothetical protein